MPPKKRPKSANTSTTARGNNKRPALPKKRPKTAQSPTQSSSSGRRSSTATSSSSSSTSLFPTTATTGSSLQEDAEEEEATFGDMTDADLDSDHIRRIRNKPMSSSNSADMVELGLFLIRRRQGTISAESFKRWSLDSVLPLY